MKEYVAELVRACPTPLHGRNVAREYLQARILGCLQRAGAMIPLAFQGGTALRFLYASSRHSEDLDFALERTRTSASSVEPSQYDLHTYLRAIRGELTAEGYAVELKVSDRRVVHSAFVRFAGLLYELGLSPHRDEMLSVKIEVDTNPPAGAVLTTTVIRRHVTLHLQHHDRASLLAGKLHAILQRPYLKGRDVYDLLWYLSDPDWPAPNLTLLNNALQQTGWAGLPLTEHNWRGMVRNRLQTLRWDQVVADVRPFLEPSADLGLLTLENVVRVLG
ncbi:MAG: nucleotidyl transferase AbiEii/AbiGii toxin family protein [Anaerolineae bacterium]|nr:nucleotidyl transferase AbiEii/AbiGii toxin family protein [Anaerolineae bacterium]